MIRILRTTPFTLPPNNPPPVGTTGYLYSYWSSNSPRPPFSCILNTFNVISSNIAPITKFPLTKNSSDLLIEILLKILPCIVVLYASPCPPYIIQVPIISMLVFIQYFLMKEFWEPITLLLYKYNRIIIYKWMNSLKLCMNNCNLITIYNELKLRQGYIRIYQLF
ncbi:hypothetical protein FORC10_p003 (plasmid) [Bacillus cereus]|nr:hypothetical protein FORC10_p003 [Bacillus cereus]